MPEINGFNSIAHAAKLLADELFYGKVNNWSEIISYFNNIPSSELDFGIDKKNLLKWHEIIKNVFIGAPSDNNRSEFMIKLNFSEDQINQVNQLLSRIRNEKKLIEILLDFYNNFPSVILETGN